MQLVFWAFQTVSSCGDAGIICNCRTKHKAVDETIYHTALNISELQLVFHFAHKIQTVTL